jgi:hypothetical protein
MNDVTSWQGRKLPGGAAWMVFEHQHRLSLVELADQLASSGQRQRWRFRLHISDWHGSANRCTVRGQARITGRSAIGAWAALEGSGSALATGRSESAGRENGRMSFGYAGRREQVPTDPIHR